LKPRGGTAGYLLTPEAYTEHGGERMTQVPTQTQTQKDFFELLDFKKTKNQEGVIASKIYEREDKVSVSRVWVEIHRAEKLYTVVFGLTTRDFEDVKYLVEMLNNVLEDFTRMRGFKRVV